MAISGIIIHKRRIAPKSVTVNACTACQQKRVKCHGQRPCSTCVNALSSSCTYKAHTRLIKEEMRCEINKLRETAELSTQILDALASKRHVVAILQGLEDKKDLSTILRSIVSPTGPLLGANSRPKVISQTDATLDTKRIETESKTEDMEAIEEMRTEEGMLETAAIDEAEGLERSLELEESEDREQSFDLHKDKKIFPDHVPARDWLASTSRGGSCRWTTALPDSLLIKQLISLYWVWIHPVHPILDMPLFLDHYEAGTKIHCSPFLVSAVCVAGCEILDPSWEGIPGKATDVVLLRQNLVIDALREEALADPDVKTTTQALAIMSAVDTRSSGDCLMTS